MRRDDALLPTARHLTAPALIGSIALSLSTFTAPPSPLDAAAAAVAPQPRTDPRVERRAEPAPRLDVVGSPAASSAVRTYTVRHGDTVSAVAARHGLRTADVLAWNDLSWRSVIHPGDILRLGSGTAKASKAAVAPAKKSTGAKKHSVRTGDTLWAIAAKYGVSVAALAKANSLGGSTMIRPGQKLTIPGTGAKARRAAAHSSAPPAKARTAASHHEVRAGETLWAIADRHDVGLARLLSANDLGAGSIIYPGQKLKIPGTAPVVARTAGEAAEVVLDDEQIANVRLIIDVGRSRGVSRDGIAIALSTAMVESWIRNLDWGDRDSLGLFQQRPSAGWGSEDEVRDRRRAAAAFFGGPRDPNGHETRGLLDIPGWQKMDFADAAQAVQISAYPERYGIWEKQAYRWLDIYG